MFSFLFQMGVLESFSDIGMEFFDYVRQLEDHEDDDDDGAVDHEDGDDVDDSDAYENKNSFWVGRKLRVYTSPYNFRQGKVLHMINSGPYSGTGTPNPEQFDWAVAIIFDTVEYKDEVKLDRPNMKGHGQHGTIVKILPNGRARVKLDGDELKFVNVPTNHVVAQPQIYEIRRMNVEGGGVLDSIVPDGPEKLSLEWQDPPSPPLQRTTVDESVACPVCRCDQVAFSATPLEGLVDSSSSPASSECPVCFHTKPCGELSCGHCICADCWSQWTATANSKIPLAVSEPVLDEAELQRERDRNYAEMKAILPHTMGGTATRPSSRRSSRANIQEAVYRFRDTWLSVMEELLQHAHDRREERGLSIFWKILRTVAAQFFCFNFDEVFLRNIHCMASLEILSKVISERCNEIETAWLAALVDNRQMIGILMRTVIAEVTTATLHVTGITISKLGFAIEWVSSMNGRTDTTMLFLGTLVASNSPSKCLIQMQARLIVLRIF
jgi:hypothetical protein